MKKKLLIIALMAFATIGYSQEANTFFSNVEDETMSFGGYGGPLIEAAQINDDWGLMLGGKGGVVYQGKFAFGGIGKGLIDGIDYTGDDLNGNNNASLSLQYGAGGVFVEYITNFNGPLQFSIPLNIMAGRITIVDPQSDDAEIESSGIFVLEPGFNLEFNLTKSFKPGLNLSYRQVFGSSLVNLENQDISGLNIGLIFKFGYY